MGLVLLFGGGQSWQAAPALFGYGLFHIRTGSGPSGYSGTVGLGEAGILAACLCALLHTLWQRHGAR